MGMIKNVTKRASESIYNLQLAHDKIVEAMFNKNDSEVLELLSTSIRDIEKAQQEMCRMIMQDLRVHDE